MLDFECGRGECGQRGISAQFQSGWRRGGGDGGIGEIGESQVGAENG